MRAAGRKLSAPRRRRTWLSRGRFDRSGRIDRAGRLSECRAAQHSEKHATERVHTAYLESQLTHDTTNLNRPCDDSFSTASRRGRGKIRTPYGRRMADTHRKVEALTGFQCTRGY